jgi:hypothetical protein
MCHRNSGGRRRHYRHAESKLAETHGCFSPIFAPAPSQRARFSTGQSAGAGIGVNCAPPLLEPQDLLESSYGTPAGTVPARGPRHRGLAAVRQLFCGASAQIVSTASGGAEELEPSSLRCWK